jgi:predicted lipid-binding transport protein (Tim44 family)
LRTFFNKGYPVRKLLTFLPLVIAALALTALPQDAEAKRMGFGQSMGRQYSTPQKSTPPVATPRQAPANAAPGAPRQSGASRWLGPIAGLVAGGLLASLFFGDAFEGFQIMDFLLIAAVVFGAVMLFRAMRTKPVAQLRTAEGPAFTGDYSQGVGAGNGDAAPNPAFDAPTWFDGAGFIKGARTHFIRLQAAWDKGDLKDIAEYTTPELFAELQAERLSRGAERHFTEVAYLDAELLDVRRDGDQVVASVRFFGGIREEQDGAVEKFTEIWHVIHAWENAAGTWSVAGIQQVLDRSPQGDAERRLSFASCPLR